MPNERYGQRCLQHPHFGQQNGPIRLSTTYPQSLQVRNTSRIDLQPAAHPSIRFSMAFLSATRSFFPGFASNRDRINVLTSPTGVTEFFLSGTFVNSRKMPS